MIGATDMGTGCDTILSQMAAECLDCDLEDIIVSGVDTDTSPYDCGSYASSTTYVTGMAVVKTCETLSRKICERGAEYLGCSPADVEFDGQKVTDLKTGSPSPEKRSETVSCAAAISPCPRMKPSPRPHPRRLLWQVLRKWRSIRKQEW